MAGMRKCDTTYRRDYYCSEMHFADMANALVFIWHLHHCWPIAVVFALPCLCTKYISLKLKVQGKALDNSQRQCPLLTSFEASISVTWQLGFACVNGEQRARLLHS